MKITHRFRLYRQCTQTALLAILFLGALSLKAADNPKTFDIKAENFQRAFNVETARTAVADKIAAGTIIVEKGEAKDSFKLQFSENVSLIGIVDKTTHEIESFTILCDPSDLNEVTRFMMVPIIVAGIVDPLSSPDSERERGRQIIQLGGKVGNQTEKVLEEVIGNIKIGAVTTHGLVCFSLEPK